MGTPCAVGPTSAAEMTARTDGSSVPGIGGADCWRTVRCPDGRFLAFALDPQAPGSPYPFADSKLIVWSSLGVDVYGGSGDVVDNFYPRRPDGAEYWPNQQTFIGDRLYSFGPRLIVRGTWDYVMQGNYGSVATVPAGGTPRFERYFPVPAQSTRWTDVQWGVAQAISGNYLYVHGAAQPVGFYGAWDGGYVARVPLASIESPTAWRFWTGTFWSTHPAQAVSTISTASPQCEFGIGGTEGGYTLHQRPGGGWQVTTKCGGSLAAQAGAYTAPNPWGPSWMWETLADCPSGDGHLAGVAHTLPTVSGNPLMMWVYQSRTAIWTEIRP